MQPCVRPARQVHTLHNVSLNGIGPLAHEIFEGLAEFSNEVVRIG